MKNLKKLLAVIVVVTLLATSMMPAFAAGSYSYTSQAQALYDLGLYKGSSTTTFEPDLGSALDRQQGVVMLIRLLGKEPAALALSSSEVDATLIIFSDAKELASWAKKHIAYAVLYKYVAGLPNGTFAPNNPLSGKEFCTMLLRALGYTVDAAGYAGACYQLSNVGGITFAEAAKFNEKELIRDDMVGIAYGVLKANYNKTGKSVIETMVADKIVTEAKAISAGVYDAKLEKDARAAIDAYKTGAITTLSEIAAVEAKKAAADAAVAKVVVAATKTALQKEIDARAAEVAAAKKNINDADQAEKDAIAAAEAAVKAYETASLATSADVTKAEGLAKTATDKANLVKTESSKKAFLDRIAAQGKKIEARKVDLANIADATAAVDAYLVAKYDTVEALAEAERLGIIAEEKVAKIADTTSKSNLTKKIDDHKKLVAAKKIELNSATVAVTADNFRVMKIVFSKPMDVGTINDINIKLNDGAKPFTVDTSKSEDKKTFYLEYLQTATQSEEVKLTISNVKDTNGVTLSSFEKTYVVKDITDPVIKSVQVVDAKSIRLYTSEPVNVPETPNDQYAYLNGDVNSARGITMTIDGNIVWAQISQDFYKGYVQLDFTSPFTAGTHSMVITSLRDFAGFATSGTFSFQIAQDKAAPVATSVEVLGKDKVKIIFNENIANAGGVPYDPSPTFYVVEAGNNPELEASRNYATSVDYKDNTAIITLTSNLTLVSTLGLDVYYSDVSDAAGNSVSTPAKLATKVQDDNVKPTVASVSVQSDNTIIVTFSEKVQKDVSNFKLLFPSKTAWLYSATRIDDYNTSNPDGKTFIVTFDPIVSSGVDAQSYILEIGSVKDASIRENEMEAKQYTIAVNDTKAPAIAVITKRIITEATDAQGTYVSSFAVDVNFTEEMNSTYVLNKSNYSVLFDGRDTTIPLSSVNSNASNGGAIATISSTDNKKVTITFTGITRSSTLNYNTIQKLSVSAYDKKDNPLTGEGAIGSLKKIVEERDIDAITNGDYAFVATDKTSASDANYTDIDYVKAISRSKIRIAVKNDVYGVPMHLFANQTVNLAAFEIQVAEAYNATYYDGRALKTNELAIIGAFISTDGKYLDLTLNKELDAYGKWLSPDGPIKIRIVTTAATTGITVKDRNGIPLVIDNNYYVDLNKDGIRTSDEYISKNKPTVADGIKPEQLPMTQDDKVIKVKDGFDDVTGLSRGDIINADSYVKVRFNEIVKSKTGISADMAQAFEIYVGTKKLTPGLHYYTVFVDNASRSESGKSGSEIYIKFSGEGSKNLLKSDLSNLTVKIVNPSYIIDNGSNAVQPR